jgi:HAE1 family hydrophobic/amphiphilic exporter-1
MIRYFSEHPTASNLLMVGILALGLNALPHLQRDTFPVTPATEVEIRVSYPGATPVEVEEAICLRLEDALDSVSGMQEFRCDARENLALATTKRRESADMGTFYDDVKSQVEAISSFPTKVERPSVVKSERVASVASIAVTGNTDEAGLLAYATALKARLQSDPRIAQVQVNGFSDRSVQIELSRQALQRHGLSLGDVQAALLKQSLDLPAGILQTEDSDWIVRFSEQRRSPRDFENLLLLSGKTGGQVRLGELATIRLVFDRPEEKTYFNGQRAAILNISKTYDQDSLWVREAIEENLARERQIAPRGINLEVSSDTTTNIRSRLKILIENGAQGLILVFLTMWLFFSLRFSFWVAMGLPVSFLGAVFAMDFLGYTLNMMSLVGLLVATGLLMDDSIVIAENIAAQLQAGKNSLEAAVRGAQQVFPGVISSFLTTAMVVGPLAFLGGNMGAVLRYIPAVLLITLGVSLLEAFLILPAHLKHSLPSLRSRPHGRFRMGFESAFNKVRDQVFVRFAAGVARQPYLWLGTVLGLALAAYAAIPSGMLKYQAFPTLESDVIQARVLLPQGTPLKRTEAVVAQLETSLKQLDEEFAPQQPKEQRLVQSISLLYNTNVDAYESGPHLATVSADLLPAGVRSGTVPEILQRWRELTGAVADVVALKFTDKERGIAGKAIDLRLQGNQLEQLKRASLDLQQFLSGYAGVRDLSDDLRPGKPELQVRLKDTAGSFGMSARGIADELRATLNGNTGMEVLLKAEAHDVVVRLSGADRRQLDDLYSVMLKAPDGTLVPLRAVAELEESRGFARIHRVNTLRTVTIQGTLDTDLANARELMAEVKKKFAPRLKAQYPGVKMVSQGQDKESADTGNSLQTNLLIGVVGVFLVLSFQFRNILYPFAVLLALPMGFFGVVVGHLLLGLELTMPSLVGLATLTGVVVNDNILLVARLQSRLKEGAPLAQAIQEAVQDRFRPIMLTSLTTIAGLLPLLSETSTQAQFLIPLVASLVFGLLAATLSSLFVVPAFFSVLEDWGKLRRTASA